jgi:hypothetical protein
MATSVDPRIGGLKANPLRIRGLRGETARKNLAELEQDKLLGRVAWRAAEAIGLTRDEICFRLKRDASTVSRWFSGAEPMKPGLLFTLGDRYKKSFVLELAKETAGVSVRTEITIGEERTA